MLWEHWITRFTWEVIAKHSFNPTSFYLNRALNAAQISDLPEEVNEKNCPEGEQTLISNLYLCLGSEDRTNYTIENPIWIWQLPDIQGFWMNLKVFSRKREMTHSRRFNYYLGNNVKGRRWKQFTQY